MFVFFNVSTRFLLAVNVGRLTYAPELNRRDIRADFGENVVDGAIKSVNNDADIKRMARWITAINKQKRTILQSHKFIGPNFRTAEDMASVVDLSVSMPSLSLFMHSIFDHLIETCYTDHEFCQLHDR